MFDENLNNNENNEIINSEIIDENVEETEAVEPEKVMEEEPVEKTENVEYEIPVSQIIKEEKPKKEHKFLKVVAYALVFGLVAGSVGSFSGVFVRKFANSKIKLESTQNYITKTEEESETQSLIADVAEQCMPSIVSITNKGQTEVMTFFGKYLQESTSSGSGIILGKNDSELLVVTNYHVVADSKELTVVFSNPGDETEDMGIDVDNPESAKNIFPAQIKGYNSDKDLAVISVKISEIPAEVLASIKVAVVGDSSKIRAGERVIAIGNALGYGQSVTTGIISATKRSVVLESQTTPGAVVKNDFIQTDAAINPGNSGGALLNIRGELIGINSVKISANGIEGMGYAIPISDVEEIIGELMIVETREVVPQDQQGFLGITGQDVSNEVSKAYGMPVGVFVSSVTEGMAADKAGIKQGYIITKFDGHTVSTIAQLQERLTYYKEGETKKITVQINFGNGYEEKELNITLGSKVKDSQKMLEKN